MVVTATGVRAGAMAVAVAVGVTVAVAVAVIVVMAVRAVAVGVTVVVVGGQSAGHSVVTGPLVPVLGLADPGGEHPGGGGPRQQRAAVLGVRHARRLRHRPGGREDDDARRAEGTAAPDALGQAGVAPEQGDLHGAVSAVLPHQAGGAEQVRVAERVARGSGDQQGPVVGDAGGQRAQPADEVRGGGERLRQHGARPLRRVESQQGAGGVGDE